MHFFVKKFAYMLDFLYLCIVFGKYPLFLYYTEGKICAQVLWELGADLVNQ